MTWPNIYLAHCQRLNFLAKAGVSARGPLFKKFFWIKNSPTSTTFSLFSSCSILQSLWKAGVSGSRPFLILFLIRRYKNRFSCLIYFFCDLAFPPFYIFWWRHQVWVAGDIYHWLFKLGYTKNIFTCLIVEFSFLDLFFSSFYIFCWGHQVWVAGDHCQESHDRTSLFGFFQYFSLRYFPLHSFATLFL